MNSNRYYALDLLRVVAALSVLLAHWAYSFHRGGQPIDYQMPWTSYGYLGVALFFLISGFVIIMSAQGNDVRTFVILRAIRLYPTFWICLLITTVLELGTRSPISVTAFIANLTMIPGQLGASLIDPVYWTLAVELEFYAMVAAALYLGILHRAEPLLWGWLVLSWFELAPGSSSIGRYAPISSGVRLAIYSAVEGLGPCKRSWFSAGSPP